MGIMLPVIYINLVAQVYLNKLIFYRKSVFPHASHLDHILLNTFTISLIMLLLKYTVNKKNRVFFLKHIHFILFKYTHMKDFPHQSHPDYCISSAPPKVIEQKE